MAEMCGGQRRQ